LTEEHGVDRSGMTEKAGSMRLNLRLGMLAVVNIGLTIAVQWYVVTRLGVGEETDALFAGMVLPQLLVVVVMGTLTHVLVPLLTTEEERAFRQTSWGLFLAVGAGFSLAALLLATAAPVWVAWLFPGFSIRGRVLTVILTRIQMIGMVLTAALSVLWSVYNARHRFLWAEFAAIPAGVAALGFLVATLGGLGVRAAAWAMVIRSGIQLLLLVPALGKWVKPDWRSPAMREAWRRSRTLLFGTVYSRTDPLVDRFLSSLAVRGELSLLALAQQIFGLGGQVLAKAWSSPLVPPLARDAAAGRWTDFTRRYRSGLAWLASLTTSGCLVVLLAGEPILRLLIGHGGVTAGNVHLLWQIMIALFGYFVGGATGQILASSFYAQGDTKTPTMVGVVGFTLGVGFKIAGFLIAGVIGIAVGTSVYYVFNALALFCFLERTLHRQTAV
jgi:putative peptidoglycan lipid II flippase